ncbi:MAG: transcription termination/antitermination protein NusG [Pirellula sp.]
MAVAELFYWLGFIGWEVDLRHFPNKPGEWLACLQGRLRSIIASEIGCSFGLALGFRVSKSETTTTESPDAGDMRWYILKVQFNREDTIREALEKRIRLSNHKALFGEILVPTEDVVEFTRAGKRRVVKRKLYPGYLVIKMVINDDTWFLVRETSGVGDFTGSGGKPTPMTDSDVEKILKMAYPDADDEQVPKTTIPFRPGDRIRVKEGNFQSLEGDVDRIDEANGRVTVIINIFGRSTPVELDHWQIESL